MKFDFKYYKVKKFQNYFINKNLFFFYNKFNSNSKIPLKQSQILLDQDFVLSNLVNSVSKCFLKHSIFKNLILLITGFIVLGSFNNSYNFNMVFKNLIKLNSELLLFGIKLNNNFYSVHQLNKIYFLNYKKNIFILNKSLKINLFFSYSKVLFLKKKSK